MSPARHALIIETAEAGKSHGINRIHRIETDVLARGFAYCYTRGPNGRKAHFGGTGHSGVAGPIPKHYGVRQDLTTGSPVNSRMRRDTGSAANADGIQYRHALKRGSDPDGD